MILLLDEPEENFTDFVENLPAHVSCRVFSLLHFSTSRLRGSSVPAPSL